MASEMRHGIGASALVSTGDAVAEACETAAVALEGRPVTLACCFLSPHHAETARTAPRTLQTRLRPGAILGCTAENLIAGTRELEGGPACVVWLAHWPGATVRTFHLEFDARDGELAVSGMPDPAPSASDRPAFLLLADPFTTAADWLLHHLNTEYPGCPAFGGLASGAWSPGGNRLLQDDRVHPGGTVGAVITGDVAVETIVSQGCRPIGRHFVITKAEGNVLLELGGRPAFEQLRHLFEELPAGERLLAQQALHVGQVIDERKGEFRRGDFLVRNVIGADPKTGAVAVGDVIRPGRTIQFQVRDAESARDDLRLMLGARRDRGALPPGSGVLFVSCNGRGSRLFGAPDVDASAVAAAFGPMPSAGFFGAGEFGPVGGRNFLHGFTASLALFGPK